MMMEMISIDIFHFTTDINTSPYKYNKCLTTATTTTTKTTMKFYGIMQLPNNINVIIIVIVLVTQRAVVTIATNTVCNNFFCCCYFHNMPRRLYLYVLYCIYHGIQVFWQVLLAFNGCANGIKLVTFFCNFPKMWFYC